jgi:thioredoxin 1
MKKIAFFFLFFGALSLNACSSNSGDSKNGNNSSSVAKSEGKVVMLTADEFKKLVWDYQKSPQTWVFNGDQPVIIDFYADWCRPCKMIAPIMEELAKEYNGKVRFYKVNTDQQRELAGLFNINSIPAVLFVPKNGKPQMSVGAMQKEGYKDAISTVLNVK